MRALHRAASDIQRRSHPAVHTKRLAPRSRTHNVHNRVYRAHFMKVNFLNRNHVNRRFRFAK